MTLLERKLLKQVYFPLNEGGGGYYYTLFIFNKVIKYTFFPKWEQTIRYTSWEMFIQEHKQFVKQETHDEVMGLGIKSSQAVSHSIYYRTCIRCLHHQKQKLIITNN